MSGWIQATMQQNTNYSLTLLSKSPPNYVKLKFPKAKLLLNYAEHLLLWVPYPQIPQSLQPCPKKGYGYP